MIGLVLLVAISYEMGVRHARSERTTGEYSALRAQYDRIETEDSALRAQYDRVLTEYSAAKTQYSETLTKYLAGSNRNTLSSTEVETGPSSGSRVTTRVYRTKCDYCSPVARPFKGTSRLRAPLIPTILPMKPTSENAKETIWRERFGGRGLFAFSGGSNAAPCATPRSPGSQAGAYIIAFLVCRLVPRVQTTVFCFIQSATTGFTANTFPYRKPLLPEEAFEGLEPDEYESLTSGSERAGPQ